ncbi:MAG: hypothetical protein ABSB91_06990 [Sedimentisphaerales bacterium]|jgi:hypothetical protein
MKRLLLIACLVFLAGCGPTPEQLAAMRAEDQKWIADVEAKGREMQAAQEAKQKAEREALISRFKDAYGEQWQQKLLEYDIEMEREKRQADLEKEKLYQQSQLERERLRQEKELEKRRIYQSADELSDKLDKIQKQIKEQQAQDEFWRMQQRNQQNQNTFTPGVGGSYQWTDGQGNQHGHIPVRGTNKSIDY